MPKLKSKTTSIDVFDTKSVIKPEEYTPYIGAKRVAELKALAKPLKGRSWTNINSTLQGGGVAEILRSLVPLARGLGVDANWFSIRGTDPFFQTTKKFHNMLQGMDLPISLEELFDAYLPMLEKNAKGMAIASDLIVVHDPQPCGLVNLGVLHGQVLWRCHIDTSNPSRVVWNFLLPYINQYHGAIFTMPEFVGPGVQVPIYEVSPCIDPRAEKNKQYSEEEARKILAPLFQQHGIDGNRPIIAAISRYDIHKNQETVLNSFRQLLNIHRPEPRPYLIFLGNTATDDPEGGEILEMLRSKADNNPDVKFWVNVKNNDKVVGALMSLAKTFVHVSTKEGFGLVVSEAMWQGTPVIGSSIGGIKKQVINGKTGFVVEPKDVEEITKHLAWILSHPEKASKLGKQAKEHVRANFLLPTLAKTYLTLMHHYLRNKPTVPKFRLNQRSHSEIQNQIRNIGLHKTNQPLTRGKKIRSLNEVGLKKI